MSIQEVAFQNFTSGVMSEKMWGRHELPQAKNGLKYSINGIIQTQGGWEFRPALHHVHHTRLNQEANLLKFEFNDVQAYQIEATHKKFRFYRNEALVLEDNVLTILDISNALQGIVTITGHLYANGDEVFFSGIKGMTGISSRYWIVSDVTANTFKIKDQDGMYLDTTALGTYTASSGDSSRVYEIDTPYREDLDLFKIKKAQINDLMYIVHPFYEPRKLTRTDHDDWSLDTYTRTGVDPTLVKTTITSISVGSPAVVSAAGHPFVENERVLIDGVGGTMGDFLNEQVYLVQNVVATVSFELFDVVTGVAVDTTGLVFAAGTAFCSNQNLLPATVSLYESRLWFAGAFGLPTKFFGSRSPQGPADAFPGNTRYDDFTVGTDPSHSVTFSIADEEVNTIRWLTSTDRFLLAGTFGSEVKIQGDTPSAAITPNSVKATALNKEGVEIPDPINKSNRVIYVQRGGLTISSLSFDFSADAFTPRDHNLLADHVTVSGVKQLAWQKGRPDVSWCLLNNGTLAAMTFKSTEGIEGWHTHNTGITEGDKFISISSMPRENNFEQLWCVAERVIDGNTRREVCFMGDPKRYPMPIDYFTGKDNKETDNARYLRALAEAQKGAEHLDSMLTYSGLGTGLDESATITPDALSGVGVGISSDVAVFESTDLGLEIHKRPEDGVGEGRALITEVTDTQNVVITVLEGAEFDTLDPMAPGGWYITRKVVDNLDHLEGRTVGVVADGSPIEDLVVTGGEITLPDDRSASVIHVGLKYEGFGETLSIEFGGVTGPPVSKNRVISEVAFRFLWTLGAEFGTDIYDPEEVEFTEMPIQVGNPTPLFTGIKRTKYNDHWMNDKSVFWRQRNPLPLTLQTLVVFGEAEES